MGLGLAIVHEVVAAHGGRVGAGPRRGGGARFWFELPALAGPSLVDPSPVGAEACGLDGAQVGAGSAPEADCRPVAY